MSKIFLCTSLIRELRERDDERLTEKVSQFMSFKSIDCTKQFSSTDRSMVTFAHLNKMKHVHVGNQLVLFYFIEDSNVVLVTIVHHKEYNTTKQTAALGGRLNRIITNDERVAIEL